MTHAFTKSAAAFLSILPFGVSRSHSVTAYDQAYRNYLSFKKLDQHQLRDIGISAADRDSARIADFIR